MKRTVPSNLYKPQILSGQNQRQPLEVAQPGRHTHFDLPADRMSDWHAEGMLMSHFLNTMSIMAPPVERFIMSSTLYFQCRTDHPQIRQRVMDLMSQEAAHRRVHSHYNRLLGEAGLPAAQLERQVEKLLKTALSGRWVSPSFRLAVVLMLEHYAALMAQMTLDRPESINDSLSGFKQLWLWHAHEEVAHKSVAYDLWINAVGRGTKAYLLRTGAFVLVGIPAVITAMVIFTALLAAERSRRLDAHSVWRFLKAMLGPQGVFPTIAPGWLRYFLPNFHPDRQDI
ncbi:metal-dependent hydrolase [Pseudomonas sp. RGM 3321]|uniref:metal-dependent hydrolase n=1 Tax=Pseudomonas sp. RGM 3321 TaxID=2930089 RepID=UPI001FCA6F21|nr:metal-dependent hydrolase [Pseudomonas sp. RGM 3321]MCJ2373607.1 metal-dependent hydrolase [Pseudomonas sp. RGM 3321]